MSVIFRNAVASGECNSLEELASPPANWSIQTSVTDGSGFGFMDDGSEATAAAGRAEVVLNLTTGQSHSMAVWWAIADGTTPSSDCIYYIMSALQGTTEQWRIQVTHDAAGGNFTLRLISGGSTRITAVITPFVVVNSMIHIELDYNNTNTMWTVYLNGGFLAFASGFSSGTPNHYFIGGSAAFGRDQYFDSAIVSSGTPSLQMAHHIGMSRLIARQFASIVPTNNGYGKTGGTTVYGILNGVPFNTGSFITDTGAANPQMADVAPFTATQSPFGTYVAKSNSFPMSLYFMLWADNPSSSNMAFQIYGGPTYETPGEFSISYNGDISFPASVAIIVPVSNQFGVQDWLTTSAFLGFTFVFNSNGSSINVYNALLLIEWQEKLFPPFAPRSSFNDPLWSM